MITKTYLKSLCPCKDRYKHYLSHYKDWSGSLEDFLDLPELTHDDKKWVFVRSIDDYAVYVAYAADAAYAAAAYVADAAAAAAAYAARLSEEKAQLEIMKKYARETLKQVKTCHHPYDGNMCINAKPGDKCPECGMNGYND